MEIKIFLLLPIIFALIKAEDKCQLAKNCYDCMGKDPSCSWCFQDAYDDDRMGIGYRCAPRKVLVERGCSDDKIESVPSKVLENSTQSSDPTKLQLSPSEITSEVRPGEALAHEFVYNSIKDYPVDLYFLVDLSYTMKDYLETVSKLTNEIVDEMKTVTKDLQIGFGVFVDKPIFPFVMPSKSELDNPCENLENVKCDPTFLYKHILSLSNNYAEFANATKNIRPSGNLDRPEGGLDALLQVVYCKKHVQWRENSRKIVLFATDGSFHLAGDGKLAGLIKPPPKECKLDSKLDPESKKSYWGWYVAGDTDYPSIGEVAHVLTEHGVSVIFATTDEFSSLYSKLAGFLPSAGVGILVDKSANIVKLLRENYEKIVNKADIGIEHEEEFLDVKVLTKCEGETAFSEKASCVENPIGGQIHYKIEVKPKKCFDGVKNITLQILGNEKKSSILVKSACQCNACTKSPMPPTSSSKCNDRGTLFCGECKCNNGYSGDFCECSDADSNISEEEMTKKCIKPGDSTPCSGRGRCACGKCKCNMNRYELDFCECDRQGCKRASDDNSVCGSKKRGTCGCDGKCTCEEGYSGEACDCLKSDDSCKDSNNKVCSNNGICDCGQCFCQQGYTGKLCNEIQGSNTHLCNDENVRNCIICLHKQVKDTDIEEEETAISTAYKPIGTPLNQEIAGKCEKQCSNTSLEYLHTKIIDKSDPNDGTNLCIIYNENCRLFFSYKLSDAVYKDRKIEVRIVKDQVCTNTTEILYIILGVILAIVLGGLLLLLIYKLVITIDDRKSYAQVVKELENSRWEMTLNPTYQQPSSTVINPTYKDGLN